MTVTTTVLGIFCFLLYYHSHKLRCYSLPTVLNPDPANQAPTSPSTSIQQDTSEQRTANNEHTVTFMAYPVRPNK
jgi:hypothetical protein